MQPWVAGGLANVAWMPMMGVDSVAYHRATVLARGDDYPGQAMAYYASRGETPLRWGGRGADGFGLQGAVTEAQYEALFGSGGACDPTTGKRLVNTKRPGLELVISAHKTSHASICQAARSSALFPLGSRAGQATASL